MPNAAVTEEEEVSTAAVAAGFLAAAIVVEGMATAVGEWVRSTAAAGMEGWAAVRRHAALQEEEVGRQGVEVRVADGPAGAEIEGTLVEPSPTGSGTRSEELAAELRR